MTNWWFFQLPLINFNNSVNEYKVWLIYTNTVDKMKHLTGNVYNLKQQTHQQYLLLGKVSHFLKLLIKIKIWFLGSRIKIKFSQCFLFEKKVSEIFFCFLFTTVIYIIKHLIVTGKFWCLKFMRIWIGGKISLTLFTEVLYVPF